MIEYLKTVCVMEKGLLGPAHLSSAVHCHFESARGRPTHPFPFNARVPPMDTDRACLCSSSPVDMTSVAAHGLTDRATPGFQQRPRGTPYPCTG
jgi:hypothetical protein